MTARKLTQKPLLAMLLVCSLLLSRVALPGGGSVIGNGGGLSEQNILFSWHVLTSEIKHCLSLSSCVKSTESARYLESAMTRADSLKDKIYFEFGDFSKQATTVALTGTRVTVDSGRIYPNGEPLEFKDAFWLLLDFWMTDAKQSLGASESQRLQTAIWALATGSKAEEWGLSRFNYPEIRLIKYAGVYYYQDYTATFLVQSQAEAWIRSNLDCASGLTDIEIYNLEDTEVKGDPGAADFWIYYNSQVRAHCGAELIKKGLRWRLPLHIDNGNFFELTALARTDLILRLQESKIRFLFY